MAEKKYKDYSQKGLSFLGRMQRPIPGQSLTESPDSKYPWEQPPEFVELQPAIEGLFVDLSEPETYAAIVDMIARGNPISDVAQIILYAGFENGLWNPDLMTLLIEPTMYMIMALVEKAGILEYQIYRGEEDEPSDGEEQIQALDNIISNLKDKVVPKNLKPNLDKILPEKVVQRLNTVEVPKSLLSKPTQEEEV